MAYISPPILFSCILHKFLLHILDLFHLVDLIFVLDPYLFLFRLLVLFLDPFHHVLLVYNFLLLHF